MTSLPWRHNYCRSRGCKKLPKNRYLVETTCKNQNGEVVVRGECMILILKEG